MIKKFTLYLLLGFFPVLAMASQTLSLDEAIVLSMRKNPNVVSTKLSALSQKFNLRVEEWKFQPHFEFGASAFYNRDVHVNEVPSVSQVTNIEPALSYASKMGTTVELKGVNTGLTGYKPGLSLNISQPLIRGYGKAIVEAALNNAKDSQKISQLQIEDTLRKTVTDVINAYLDIVLAENTLTIDNDTLKRAQHSVKQTKLFIEAGRKAKNELVTVLANVATEKLKLEHDKNNLTQTKYAFLTAIGIDPNRDITILTSDTIKELTEKYAVTNLQKVKQQALSNNIQYQIDLITIYGQKTRDLAIAKDNTRMKLDFSTTLSTGGGIVNAETQSQSVGFSLKIPIDDLPAKQGLQNAKIAMKQALIALRTEKWSIETNATNAWHNMESSKAALIFAEEAEGLQEKTYKISYQKYSHGLIDSLELQSALISLSQAKNAYLVAQINHIRSLVNLDLLIGHTLETWALNVRTK